MLSLLIRGLIIYIVLIASVRIMGKRQIGELQPSELVITILLSQIAAIPIENSETPLLRSVISIVLLVSLEVLSSILIMKIPKIKTIIQGNKIIVIKDGNIIEKNIRNLRFTIDDLLEALRLKDVFDVSLVKIAYIETNGALSVKLKNSNEPITLEVLNLEKSDEDFPYLVISDGKIIENEFSLCNLTKEKLIKILNKNKIKKEDVLLMTYARDGSANIIKKE